MLNKNEEKDDNISIFFSSTVDAMANRRKLLQMLGIGITVNFLFWIAVFVFPKPIYKGFSVLFNINSKIMMAAFVIHIFFTAVSVYALFRLKFPNVEEQNFDSDFMSSVSYQSASNKRFMIWVGSFAIGVFNTIFLILADLALADAI